MKDNQDGPVGSTEPTSVFGSSSLVESITGPIGPTGPIEIGPTGPSLIIKSENEIDLEIKSIETDTTTQLVELKIDLETN